MFFFNAVRRGLESNLGSSGGWAVDWLELEVRDCFATLQER